MVYNWMLIFEILGFTAYFLVWADIIRQQDKWSAFTVLSATFYGWLLEAGNIYFAHTYYYNPDFYLQISSVPLVIGCGWAIIIYSLMRLHNSNGLNIAAGALFDALLAMLLDMVIDPVAVRMGLWHWQITLDQEFFGVPYENLFAWLAVVFCFSFLIRYLQKSKIKNPWQIIIKFFSPFISYLMLLLILGFYGVLIIFPAQFISGSKDFTLPPEVQNIYSPEAQIFKLVTWLMAIFFIITFVWRQKNIGKFLKPDFLPNLIIKGIFVFFIFASFFSEIRGTNFLLPMVLIFITSLFYLISFLQQKKSDLLI